MLREKDGIFIAAAVFIAAQRRGESGVVVGAWLMLGLSQRCVWQWEGVGGETLLWREWRGYLAYFERWRGRAVCVCLRNEREEEC